MAAIMVRAIRGAITVSKNDSEEILQATSELLTRIVEDNSIDKEDIISAVFTVTKDLNAAFPAVAARRLGWTDIALTSVNEMEVPGSLSMCIRVLLHFNTDKKNSDLRYVYLREAVRLRPDIRG
jgi:chorismate mutase